MLKNLYLKVYICVDVSGGGQALRKYNIFDMIAACMVFGDRRPVSECSRGQTS